MPTVAASPALSDLGEAGPQRVCVEENGGLFWPFPLPSSYSASGNLFLMLSFGYILLSAAGLISKGSELLLEVSGTSAPAMLLSARSSEARGKPRRSFYPVC